MAGAGEPDAGIRVFAAPGFGSHLGMGSAKSPKVRQLFDLASPLASALISVVLTKPTIRRKYRANYCLILTSRFSHTKKPKHPKPRTFDYFTVRNLQLPNSAGTVQWDAHQKKVFRIKIFSRENFPGSTNTFRSKYRQKRHEHGKELKRKKITTTFSGSKMPLDI